VTSAHAATLGAAEDPVLSGPPPRRQYAGQQLLTGQQAEAYADHFIAVHIANMGGGKTYSQGRPRTGSRPHADAAPGDPGGDNANDHFPVPGRPWLDARAGVRVQLIRGHVVGRPLNEHAPATPGTPVDLVDLECHVVVRARDPGPQVLIERAVLRGTEHDRPAVQRVVHRQHDRPEPADVGDPADPSWRYKLQALILAELLEYAVSHRGCPFLAWRSRP
jgi:hypothetical protein